MDPKDALLLRLFSVATAVDDSETIFRAEPDALAFGASAYPLAGFDEGLADKLNVLLNLAFPAGTVMQFILWTSPDLEATLRDYELLRRKSGNALLNEITQQRVSFLRGGAEQPMESVSGLRLHDRRLLITVRVPVGSDFPSEDKVARVRELREAFVATLKTIGFGFEALRPENYLRFLQTVMNPRPQATWRASPHGRYDPTRLLCHQVLDADSAIDYDDDGLTLGGRKRVKLLSVKHYPEAPFFGNALRYVGDVMTGARGIRDGLLITLNLRFPDHETERTRREADHAWATRQTEGRLTRYIKEYGLRKQSLDVLMEAVRQGDRIVDAYLSLAVFADSEEESVRALNNARTYWQEIGFTLMQDRYFVCPLFFAMLPFANDEAIGPSLMRYKTMATRHVVPLMPVLGAWRGTGTPLLTLFSRDGQLMSLSPFDANAGFNSVVAAQTGSGKSFLVNELVSSFQAMGAQTWIIDVGGSYKNLCGLLGGTYVQFTSEAHVSLNPFSIIRDINEEADMIAGILTVMAAPRDGLDDFQAAGLKRVLNAVYAAHERATTVDLVASALLAEDDQRLKDIGHQLYPWTARGEYGRYFIGENTFRSDNPLVVCELEELKGRKHLQRVVLLSLIYQINQEVYLGDRARKKFLAVDEAWDLLASDETRDFIVHAYRRFRKYGASVLVATQSVNDLWSNQGAIAIVENSSNWFLLSQRAESIALVQREARLPFGEAGYRLLRTVSTEPGEYSEIFAITPRGAGVGRLVVSPFNRLLYSTRAEDVAAIRELERRGVGTVDAVNQILKHREQRRGPGRAVA